MQAFMGSLFINNFTLYNRTYHVVIQADTDYRALIEDMNKYYVRNAAGFDGAVEHADQLSSLR